MRRFVKNHNRFCQAAAFFLPFLICVLICVGNGVYPFGENCILHMDMYHQYCPFFTEFMEKLKQGGSLMYSWNLGLGSDFVSLYAYYLASPLNLLLIFCPKSLVIEAMTLFILVKIGLCGLFFFLFLKYHYRMVGNDGKMHANLVLPALVFSTAYALSGFVAAYSWDIMWMDCIALFPLIVMGLEKLVREKKPGLYFVTLAVSIFANYYISIMICIFLVFYFILLFVQEKGDRLGAFLRFFWYSLLAGGASAILLFPEIKMLASSGSARDSFPETLEWYFNIPAEFGRMAATASPYEGNDHWPNLYAGVFTLLLVGMYFLNRRISWKEKLPRLFMLAFFMVSFACNQLDYIWHGMHFPQGLPGRQSFLFIFILLTMGFEALWKWKGNRPWHVLMAGVSAMLLIFWGFLAGDSSVTEDSAILITELFLALYMLLFLMVKLVQQTSVRPFITGFCLCAALGELTVNMAAVGLPVTSRTYYCNKQESYEKLLEMAEEDSRQQGEVFYRVEDTGRKTKNDDAMYGYPSATIFSSLMNLDVSHLFQSLYMEGGKNFYCYNGATPLSSALFSVRYMLSDNAFEEGNLRTLAGREGDCYLYRNNYCLPLGFMMPESAINCWQAERTDRIGSLNSLADALGARGKMLYPADCVVDNQMGDSYITISEEGCYYASYSSCNTDSLTITREDGFRQTCAKTSHRYLLNLGECKAGEEVHIVNRNGEKIDFTVYRLNREALDEAYAALGSQTLETESVTDREVMGRIQVREPGRLIFSIPADDGWKLYVDGRETEVEPFKEALIGVNLEAGEHEIRLKYTTPGLYAGALVSAASVILAGMGLLISRRGR